MDKRELARRLFAEDDTPAVSMLTAKAVSDSADGMVRASLNGTVLSIPTAGGIKAGDTVRVLAANGHLYAPGSNGNMDDMAADVAHIASTVISSVDIEYASGTSATEPPTSGWSTDAPHPQPSRYIWQRVATTSNGKTTYSSPMCITHESSGGSGQGGAAVGISGMAEEYYLSISDTTPTGGEWSQAQPVWSEGHYIWTRGKISWTDSTTTYTTPVMARVITDIAEQADKATWYVWSDEEGQHITSQKHSIEGANLLMSGSSIRIRNGKMMLGVFERDKISLAGGKLELTYIDMSKDTYLTGESGILLQSSLSAYGEDAVMGVKKIYLPSGDAYPCSVISTPYITAAKTADTVPTSRLQSALAMDALTDLGDGLWLGQSGGMCYIQALNVGSVSKQLPSGVRPMTAISSANGTAAVCCISDGTHVGYMYVSTSGRVWTYVPASGKYSGQLVFGASTPDEL